MGESDVEVILHGNKSRSSNGSHAKMVRHWAEWDEVSMLVDYQLNFVSSPKNCDSVEKLINRMPSV